MNIYYVYAYINSKTNLPYYIGKGKNDRAYQSHGRVKIPKDKSKIVFLERNLTEIGALALERRYIKWYGRKSDNTGILLNLLEGGQGSCLPNELNGMYGKKHTEETRKKMSDKHWTKRKEYSQSHKEKISKAVSGENHPLYGKKHSPETKKKLSIAAQLREQRKRLANNKS